MLYVKAEVRPSPIHRYGLFAVEPIAKGTLIFRWNSQFGIAFGPTGFSLLPPQAQEYVKRYGWRQDELHYLDVDDSRFVNHSETPNMIVTRKMVITSVAARDIAAGEELTEDYSTFDDDFDSYKAELRG